MSMGVGIGALQSVTDKVGLLSPREHIIEKTILSGIS